METMNIVDISNGVGSLHIIFFPRLKAMVNDVTTVANASKVKDWILRVPVRPAGMAATVKWKSTNANRRRVRMGLCAWINWPAMRAPVRWATRA